ncbi:MAG TPA: helicase-related protein, partial [Roseateles sp.]|nr:helicase-related protein [Roseateles sp.]
FLPDLQRIINLLPKKRQNLMFSATFSPEIKKLASSFLTDPITIEVARSNATAEKVTQVVYKVAEDHKRDAVANILRQRELKQVIVFSNTKTGASRLARGLAAEGMKAAAIHGDKTQQERMQALDAFKKGEIDVLVATDVAARGLDIAQLECVINVDMSQDAEAHVHRIGRTGRAGAEGLALSLASLDEMGRVGRIEQLLGREFQWQALDQLAPADGGRPLQPAMDTLQILGGRKDKIRPGDVLGALTGEAGFESADIGKINITDFHSYVAVRRELAREVVKRLSAAKLKGRKVKVRRMADLAELA